MAEREFRVVIPKNDNNRNRISADYLTTAISRLTATMPKDNQGATVYPLSLGCWRSPEGEVFCDENMVVELVAQGSDHDVQQAGQRLEKVLKEIGAELGQQAMFDQVVVGTTTHFLPAIGRRVAGYVTMTHPREKIDPLRLLSL